MVYTPVLLKPVLFTPVRDLLAIDTETERFSVRNQAPKLVCLSSSSTVLDTLSHRKELKNIITNPVLFFGCELVFHNGPFDLAVLARFNPKVLPLIFDALWQGRIHDTMIREQLIDIAFGRYQPKVKGRYTLAALAKKYLGQDMDKDTYRMNYGDLIDVPLGAWPQGAIDYAKGDAIATRQVAAAQYDFLAEKQPDGSDNLAVLVDEPRQVAWSFVYHLMTCYGMVTDTARVATLKASTQGELDVLRDALADAGFIKKKVSKSGVVKYTRDVKKLRQAVLDAYGPERCPRTPKGQPATNDTALAAHDALKPHSAYVHKQKMLSTYISVLEKGVNGGVIHGKFHLLETGRRGASDNMQTLPGDAGIRECYRARRGYVLGTVDYNSIELRCWSQVMVNWFGVERVPMAQLYRANPDADPHLKFAADFYLGIDYAEALGRYQDGDDEVKKARKRAKIANFGIPGGMGIATFVRHAKRFGYDIDEREGKYIKDGWCDVWNARPYFDRVSWLAKNDGFAVQEYSQRVRGGLGYCDMANGFFQALASDGHSRSLFMISRECYTKMTHPTPLADAKIGVYPLYGSRPVNALHDEIIAEFPEDKAHDALARMEYLMVKGMSDVCPDVPIRVEGALMTHWSKDAKRIVKDGRVQVDKT